MKVKTGRRARRRFKWASTTSKRNRICYHCGRHYKQTEPRQVVKEEDRTVSELLREAIRLYMEEREWRRRERLERLRSRQAEKEETRGGQA